MKHQNLHRFNLKLCILYRIIFIITHLIGIFRQNVKIVGYYVKEQFKANKLPKWGFCEARKVKMKE